MSMHGSVDIGTTRLSTKAGNVLESYQPSWLPCCSSRLTWGKIWLHHGWYYSSYATVVTNGCNHEPVTGCNHSDQQTMPIANLVVQHKQKHFLAQRGSEKSPGGVGRTRSESRSENGWMIIPRKILQRSIDSDR